MLDLEKMRAWWTRYEFTDIDYAKSVSQIWQIIAAGMIILGKANLSVSHDASVS